MLVADVSHSYDLSRTINIDLLSDHLSVNDEVDDGDEDEVGDSLDAELHVVDIVLVDDVHIDVMGEDDQHM